MRLLQRTKFNPDSAILDGPTKNLVLSRTTEGFKKQLEFGVPSDTATAHTQNSGQTTLRKESHHQSIFALSTTCQALLSKTQRSRRSIGRVHR